LFRFFRNETFSVYDPTITHAWEELGCESLTEAPSIEDEMTEACQEAENFIRDISLQRASRTVATDYIEVISRRSTAIGTVTGAESGSRVQVPAGELPAGAAVERSVEA